MAERFYGIIHYGHDWRAKGVSFFDYVLKLQELGAFPEPQRFLAYLFKRRRRRFYRWNRKNRQRLREELSSCRVSWFLAEDRDTNDRGSHGTVWVEFGQHLQSKQVNYCITAGVIPDDSDALWDIICASGELAIQVRSPYGCVVTGNSVDEIVAFASGTTLVPMSKIPSIIADGEIDEQSHLEFGAWSQHQKLIDKFVRGAYWGNFLNADHLGKLGGKAHVFQQPFVRKHKEFDDGHVFFSTTSKIEEAMSEEGLRRLQKLYEFLKPIGLPEFGQTPA